MTTQNSNTRLRGRLRQWNANRGYGFIYCQGERYFVHVSNIVSGIPEIGRICTFDVGVPPTAADRAPAVRVEIGEMFRGTAGVRQ